MNDMYEDAKKENIKKDRLCVSISHDIFNRFKQHVDTHGYDQSRLVERILTDFLNKVEQK